MFVTIFTPVYNREKSIRDVYESLCAQTCKDFEWLVINDGSTDGTSAILEKIIVNHDNSFPINYVSKKNEGLNRTINKGLDYAKGIMFMRLDSDDTALSDAVEKICKYYPAIAERDDLCALAFYALDKDNRIVGWHPFDVPTVCNFPVFRDKYHGRGDRSEVMKVSVFRNYKFPEFDGEKFCPEALVWNRISRHFDALYLPEPIYRKGSPEDSITADVYNYLKRNCIATTMLYQEIIQDTRLSYGYRLQATIRYYRYVLYSHFPFFKGIPLSLFVLGFPIGMAVVVYDYFHNR